jgi:hypothetical protein
MRLRERHRPNRQAERLLDSHLNYISTREMKDSSHGKVEREAAEVH